MDRQEASTVASALDAASLPTPDAVTEAEAFATVAADLARKLRALPAPDLETATAATAAKVVDAAASYDVTHAAKLANADRLANLAEARALSAWQSAALASRAALREAFNRAADELADTLAACARPVTLASLDMLPVIAPDDWAPIGAVCGKLDALAALRDRLAFWHGSARNEGTHSDRFEKLSRHLRVLDVLALTNPEPHLRVGDSGPAHWIAAHQSERVRIAWQEHDEQRDNAHALRI